MKKKLSNWDESSILATHTNQKICITLIFPYQVYMQYTLAIYLNILILQCIFAIYYSNRVLSSHLEGQPGAME